MAENMLAPDPTGVIDGYSPAEPYRSPEADKRLLSQIRELFRNAQEHRSEFDRAWDLFRLYLKGEQLIVHKQTGELIRLTAEDSKRLRSVKNSLRPTSRSLVGKLTRTIPSVRVVPPSNDFEDTHGAQVADALLQFIRRKEELDLKYQEACEFLPWAGNAYLHLYWDPESGETRAHCETCGFTEAEELIESPCPQCTLQRQQEMMLQTEQLQAMQTEAWDEQLQSIPPDLPEEMIPEPAEIEPPPMQQLGPLELGAEIPTLIEVQTGDVKVRVKDPRDIYFEPGINCVKDARYFVDRELMPVSKIRAMFPEMASFIQKETMVEMEDDLRHYRNDNSSNPLDDHAYLFRVEEAPTEAYEEGRIVWIANDIILKEIPHPIYSDIGRFSLFHIGWDRNAGEFYFEPFIQQAWHRQRELNNNETAIREHMELLLRSKVLVPLGSRITTDEFSATSAQVIAFNRSAGEPLKWDPPPLPTGFLERGPMLEADIRQQAGITDADIGMQQSDPNGRAMAIIQAEADQQLGPITRRNNAEYRDLNRCALIMGRKFWPQDYLWTVAGPDGVEKYYIYEMNLSGPIDVELEAHDGASSNPALRLQQGIDLASLGYFMDPATGLLNKKDFARFTKLHDVSSGYNMEATERAAAAAIPAKIKNGEMIQPHTFDDPMIFAEVLLQWLRGPGRRSDPALAMQVEMIWQFYVMWAMTGAMPGTGFPAIGAKPGEAGQMMNPMAAQGGAGPGGPDQTAPGGSANNPGHLGSDRPIAAQAGQTISMADSHGEGAARTQSQHEG